MQDTVNAFASLLQIKGTSDGPLAGLTFAAKDLFDVAGHVTGCGNPEWARTHTAAKEHAWAVERTLAAGATLVGKTHTDELAYSLMGVNAHYGTPINSADPRRAPGGSSSGSASAVAAGLVDFALGTDTGGSVRMPATFCGIWGIRTTFGQVPVDGVMPFTHSFDTVGWFARDGKVMADVARALSTSEAEPIRSHLFPVDIWARADAEVVSAMVPALQRLQTDLGPITPVILAPEGLDTWREVFRICQAGEVWDILGDWVSDHNPDFGPGIKDRFEMAAGIDAGSLAENNSTKSRIAERMSEIVRPGSALVMPTSPAPAPLLTASNDAQNAFRTRALEMLCPAGLAGLPQLSVPAGIVDQGPVGISLVGAKGQDQALIALARDAGLGHPLA